MEIYILFMVMAGGAAGAVARFGLNTWIQNYADSEFPYGTMVINISGSFMAGTIVGFALSYDLPEIWAFGILTGFLGSFTTFSTWMVQSITLLDQRLHLQALMNLVIPVAAGVLSALAGIFLAEWFMP